MNKADFGFLPNPRQDQAAPAVSCPALGAAQPAGAVFIQLSFSVPGELDLVLGMFIGVDFFSLCAANNRTMITGN